MIEFEPGASCDVIKVIRSEPHRLQANELEVNELYLIITALTGTTMEFHAAAFSTRIVSNRAMKRGFHKVKVDLYDDHMQPMLDMESRVKDGYWLEPGQLTVNFGGSTDYEVHKAYFMPHQAPLVDELAELTKYPLPDFKKDPF